MATLSNKDFEYLTKEQSPRLKAIAKKRVELDRDGVLSMDDLQQITKVCAFSGDTEATKWLKNLQGLVVTGRFMEVTEDKEPGNHVFMTHVLSVHRRCKKGELPFDISERVIVKDSGKLATVVDFNDSTEKYILLLPPFQVVECSKKEITKNAHCGKDHTAAEEKSSPAEEAALKHLKEQQAVWEKEEKSKPKELKDVKDEELDDALKGLGARVKALKNTIAGTESAQYKNIQELIAQLHEKLVAVNDKIEKEEDPKKRSALWAMRDKYFADINEYHKSLSELRKLKKNAQDFKALYASMDSAAKRLSSAIQNGAVAVSRGQQPDLQAFNAAFTDANAVFDEAIRIYASSGNAEWQNVAKVLQDRKQAIQSLSTQFNSLISEWSGKVTEQNQQPFLQAKDALLLLVEDYVSLN